MTSHAFRDRQMRSAKHTKRLGRSRTMPSRATLLSSTYSATALAGVVEQRTCPSWILNRTEVYGGRISTILYRNCARKTTITPTSILQSFRNFRYDVKPTISKAELLTCASEALGRVSLMKMTTTYVRPNETVQTRKGSHRECFNVE